MEYSHSALPPHTTTHKYSLSPRIKLQTTNFIPRDISNPRDESNIGYLMFGRISVCASSPDKTENDRVLKFGSRTPFYFFEKRTQGAAGGFPRISLIVCFFHLGSLFNQRHFNAGAHNFRYWGSLRLTHDFLFGSLLDRFFCGEGQNFY